MKFDKSKVYTALTADELQPGDIVITADTITELKGKLSSEFEGEVLTGVLNEEWYGRFEIGNDNYALAYLVERNRCKNYKPKTNRNLCDSCKHCFAECPATPGDIIFGCGVGNDNVYACAKYEKKSNKICVNCENFSSNYCNVNRGLYFRGYCNKHNRPTEYNNTCCDYCLKTEQKVETPDLISLGNGQYAERKHYRPFKDTDELIKVWFEKGGKWQKRELAMPYIWVRRKTDLKNCGHLVTDFNCVGVTVQGQGYAMSGLFANFEFLDGSPCGVEA